MISVVCSPDPSIYLNVKKSDKRCHSGPNGCNGQTMMAIIAVMAVIAFFTSLDIFGLSERPGTLT